MKIVIAPDKFKGSLTGIEFCQAVDKGISQVFPNAEIVYAPMADGGDGTIDVVKYYIGGEKTVVNVHDPLFRPINASYLYGKKKATAYIEMAEASGLKLLNKDDCNCMHTTSLGTGELIKHAIMKGAKHIILGIGGSATNDAGIGMAKALGYVFYDKNKQEVVPIGKNLKDIVAIDKSNVTPSLQEVSFKIACDVTNPLYGDTGATRVYGSQKGANPQEIILLESGMTLFSEFLKSEFGIDGQQIRGAGAAGGMGAGAIAFLNGTLTSGIQVIKELADFDTKILDADWIITGEGQIDSQTLSGKTIQGVLASAQQNNIPVAAFCGSVDLSIEEQNKLNITHVSSVLKRTCSLDQAMKSSYDNLIFTAYNFSKILAIKVTQ